MKPTDKVRFDVNKDGVVKAEPREGTEHRRKNYYLSMAETAKVALPSGPSGIALDADDSRLVSFSQIDGSVSLTPLDAFKKDSTAKTDTIKLCDFERAPAGVAWKGTKNIFSGGDSRVSKDGRACSSCHPDGRDDGLVWSTPTVRAKQSCSRAV